MAQARYGDYGTVYRITVVDQNGAAVDVSTASTKALIFRSPDGTDTSYPASFATDGTDGALQYTTASGDLDTPGRWRVFATVTLASGRWTTVQPLMVEVI